MAAVWGQMATKERHAPLSKAMSVLESFIANKKETGSKWWTLLEQNMKEAAEEEKQLAIDRCTFHEDVPAISDSGWG